MLDDNLNENDSYNSEEIIPREILNEIPEDKRKKLVGAIISRERSFFASGSMPHPLIEKTTPEHVSEMIKNADKDSEREYNDRKEARKFVQIILVMVFIFILALILLLAKDNPNLLTTIISSIVTLVAGAFGGFGYGFKKGKEED